MCIFKFSKISCNFRIFDKDCQTFTIDDRYIYVLTAFYSREEILAMKKRNPIEALRRLQNLRKLSNKTNSLNSSNAFVTDVSDGSVNLVIQPLKANVFNDGLFKAIDRDVKLGVDIQKLTLEINKQRIPNSLIQFLFEFEALFDHICRDIQLRKTYDAQIQQKMRNS